MHGEIITLIVELYMRPKKVTSTQPAVVDNCVALDKQCAFSTDYYYSPEEQAVKQFLEHLDNDNRIHLKIYDLNDTKSAIRARFKGVSGPSLVLSGGANGNKKVVSIFRGMKTDRQSLEQLIKL